MNRPETGEVEQRSIPEGELTVEGNTLHGLIPYGVESRDLGKWTEVMEPGSLSGARMDDLVATLNHDANKLLGRLPGTLKVEERDDGLAWSCELPDGPTGQDVREAVRRGDLNATSWRMVVGKDRWQGRVRHVEEVRELRDVAVVTTAAYPAEATRAELRERPENETDPPERQEAPMEDETPTPAGGLQVEDRAATPEPERPVEVRILDAMAAVPKGEARDLTHANATPVEPEQLGTFVWDAVLPDQSVVLASGVPVTPIDRKSLKLPTLVGDVDAEFYDELEAINESDPDLDELEITPKAIKALVRGSSEAFEDSDPDLLTLVRNNIARALALRLDGELIVGDSAKGFKGIGTIEGSQELALDGAIEDWDPFVKAAGLLAEAGVPGPYVSIAHPRVVTTLRLLKEETDSIVPLAPPEGVPAIFQTRQAGLSGADPDATTDVLVYAPAQLRIARRRDVTIEVDRSEEFSSDSVLVRGKLRAAIGTATPEAIVRITGVDAPPINPTED